MKIVTLVHQALLGLIYLLSGSMKLISTKHSLQQQGLSVGGAVVLASQKQCKTYFEVPLQGHPATCEEYFIQLPSGRLETPSSHDLFSGKGLMMNTNVDAKKQGDMAAPTETFVADLERLARCGFTDDEIVSLLWLRQWYQTGGSDRVAVLRHWEFLKLLVLTGGLEV